MTIVNKKEVWITRKELVEIIIDHIQNSNPTMRLMGLEAGVKVAANGDLGFIFKVTEQ